MADAFYMNEKVKKSSANSNSSNLNRLIIKVFISLKK